MCGVATITALSANTEESCYDAMLLLNGQEYFYNFEENDACFSFIQWLHKQKKRGDIRQLPLIFDAYHDVTLGRLLLSRLALYWLVQ